MKGMYDILRLANSYVKITDDQFSVCARTFIPKDGLIEVCPLIELVGTPRDTFVFEHLISDGYNTYLPTGNYQLYNTLDVQNGKPNAYYEIAEGFLLIKATQPIIEGQEIILIE